MARPSSFGVRIGRTKINDTHYPVYCQSAGWFSVLNVIDGEDLPEDADVEPLAQRAATVEAAENQARETLRKRKVKVTIPFRFHDGRVGTAYGIHAGNGDILVRSEQEGAERLRHSTYRGAEQITPGVFVADIPQERVDRFKQIGEEIDKLKGEAQEIVQWYGVDLRSLVLDEIERKIQEKS